MFFQSRMDAGLRLAEIFLTTQRDYSGWTVAGIARGGVIVGAQLAKALNLKLQAICADDYQIDEDNLLVASSLYSGFIFNKKDCKKPPEFVPDIRCPGFPNIGKFIENLDARTLLFNGSPYVPGDKVIICDDGLVSGRTLVSAVASLRNYGVKEILAAIPVIPRWAADGAYGFEIITWRVSKLSRPATGIFYFNFEDVPDEEVTSAVRECGTPQ